MKKIVFLSFCLGLAASVAGAQKLDIEAIKSKAAADADGRVLSRRLEDVPGAPVVRLIEAHNWDVGLVVILSVEGWRAVSLLEFAATP